MIVLLAPDFSYDSMNKDQILTHARLADILASLYLNRPNTILVVGLNEVAKELAEGTALAADNLPITENIIDLQADYDALFFVPVSGRYLPPYESAQRAQRLWGPITHQVADFYASVGFDPAELRMDDLWRDLNAPDHIGIELACLSALLQTSASETGPALETALEYFLQRHLMRWLPAYSDELARNAQTSLYQLLGKWTGAFLQAM